ncbi:hypothetical protein ACMYSQ_004504 [Aspergillus niger]
MSIPGNLVFDPPFPLPPGYAFSSVYATAPDIQPELMDTDFRTWRFDLLHDTDMMELGYSLPGGQDTENYSHLVGRRLTTLGLPLPSSSDVLFPESSSLTSMIPYQETMSSHPISVGQPQGTTESMPYMGWIVSDVNDAECYF